MSSRAARMLATYLLLAFAAAPMHAAEPTAAAGRVDFARARAVDAEPGEWMLHGRDFGEQRYSPLAQIERSNVARLGLAWSFDTGARRGMEATPIVVDGVLYATASWSVVFALDAASGRLLWRYDPQVPKQKGRDACCDVVNRGVAVWKGRVYVGALDGRLIALDAKTGRLIWQVQTTDAVQAYTITGAPRVVKDLVVIGNGGAEFGVRGYFSAYRADSGERVWRFYTVPASKQGPHEHPELELAAKTWPADSLWESGLGGTAWDSMAYDPELDLLYVGTGNASVYDRSKRSPGGGDNLFVSSILAVRPDTGRLIWHYQTTPGDTWDYTATQHIVLADLEIGGARRRVLMQAPKNGFFYVLDRASGELLSAQNYVDVSWASHIDLATGRPVERPEAQWGSQPRVVTPSIVGGHNWNPMSFSPRTGLVYVPTISAAYPFTPDPKFRYTRGRMNTAEDLGRVSASMEGYEEALRFCTPTHLSAWDPVAQRQAWRVTHEAIVPGGTLATAGDLVFQGRGDGGFAAYDARSGAPLWESRVGVGIMAPPISYRVAGEQYVAVLSGIGGSMALDFSRHERENIGRILTWKLDGKAPMPETPLLADGQVQAPALPSSAEDVERGRSLYAEHCLRCHGAGARSSMLMPDLRFASRQVHEQWNDIVLGGTRAAQGMASFADVISEPDARAIHAYVISRALHEPARLEQLVEWLGQFACVPVAWVTD